ncbi:MAG: hypothetical protein LBH42_07150, partial [Treponema sp.]|nr:hypothetical protein [Treponema sp.]
SFSVRLREADFLEAPQILREEAIFTGADMVAAENQARAVPKRVAVRRVAKLRDAADLGPVRVTNQDGFIYLKAANKPGERGFSLLIKEEGLYTLKARTFSRRKPDLLISAGVPQDGKTPAAAFYARFPLIFRNHEKRDCILKGGYKRRFVDILDREARTKHTVVTACDAGGPVAFVVIGTDPKSLLADLIVISRDTSIEDTDGSLVEVFLEYTGGKDV